jgi:uncharacterized repeat protein (TIGR03843 family)
MTVFTLLGRVLAASNATFIGELDGTRVIYKPIAGERPLWDFPDGTLASREYAAWLVDQEMGGLVVPRTWLENGPHGPGMVQEWCEPVESDIAVDVVSAGQTPGGWLEIFEGVDEADQPVVLVHEDSAALRRMALLDAVINNSDRKGGHVLALGEGRRRGVDHGVAFHQDNKLRTVLWGWVGQTLRADELDILEDLLKAFKTSLVKNLAPHLTAREVQTTQHRVTQLLDEGTFPQPSPHWPAIPWPAF